MDPQLNLVVIRASDLDASQRFYESLGLRFVRERHGQGPEHLAAEMGGLVFEIYPRREASTTATRIGVRVPSVSRAIAAATSHGGSLVSPPKASPWGTRAVLTDPDGHKVELSEPQA